MMTFMLTLSNADSTTTTPITSSSIHTLHIKPVYGGPSDTTTAKIAECLDTLLSATMDTHVAILDLQEAVFEQGHYAWNGAAIRFVLLSTDESTAQSLDQELATALSLSNKWRLADLLRDSNDFFLHKTTDATLLPLYSSNSTTTTTTSASKADLALLGMSCAMFFAICYVACQTCTSSKKRAALVPHPLDCKDTDSWSGQCTDTGSDSGGESMSSSTVVSESPARLGIVARGSASVTSDDFSDPFARPPSVCSKSSADDGFWQDLHPLSENTMLSSPWFEVDLKEPEETPNQATSGFLEWAMRLSMVTLEDKAERAGSTV